MIWRPSHLLLAMLLSAAPTSAVADGAVSFEACMEKAYSSDRAGALKCFRGIDDAQAPPLKIWLEAQLLIEFDRLDEAVERCRAYLGQEGIDHRREAEAALSKILPRARGRIEVRCAPVGASVRVAGEVAGACPMVTDWLTPGEHRVDVVLEDEVAYSETVAVVAGPSAIPCCMPPPAPVASLGRLIGAALFVTGVAGLGVGGAYHYASASAADSYERTGAASFETEAYWNDRVDGPLKAAIVLYGVGLAAMVGGSILWMAGGTEEHDLSLSVGPNGLAVGGAW